MDELLPGLAAVVARRMVFLRREALAAGYDEPTIQKRTRSGAWVRVRPGAYVVREHWVELDEADRYVLRVRAREAAASRKGVHSHVTSAVLHGAPTWGLPLSDVHVTHERGKAGRRETGVHHHRSTIAPGDVVMTDGLRHTAAARTIIEVFALCGLDAAVSVGNDLLHREVTDMRSVESFAAVARHWPGTLATELLLRTLDSRVESVAESRFVLLCRRNDIHGMIPQLEIRDGSVFLGRVDFAFPEFGVFVEVDGKGKYTRWRKPGQSAEDVLWEEKTRQERIAACTGWECIRITWADLERPAQLLRRLRSALERGRARMGALKALPPVSVP